MMKGSDKLFFPLRYHAKLMDKHGAEMNSDKLGILHNS
jgi:hypothetical protein